MTKVQFFISFLNILLCTYYVQGHLAEKLTLQNPCTSKATCHECIQTPSCAWCFKPNYDERARCFQPSIRTPMQCPQEFVYNPGNVEKILINRELSRASGSSDGGGSESASGRYGGYEEPEIVQIRPQRVNLKLRAKQSYNLWMHYTQAEDYPIDLYYLMDLSKSMEDEKHKLLALGNLLAKSISNITSNFRIGFGSFVDKVVMPFKNHMSLSTNISQFSQMVEHASVSCNLDAPEGGFDAIMQAVVCRDQIGWRNQARRLLLFSTDGGFHYAGDGNVSKKFHVPSRHSLGGKIKPNDGMCHLENGHYTHSIIQDYPSIPQINLKVKENAINVIFAVTETQLDIYRELQNNIEGAFIGKLSNDSSNVVDLVKVLYEQISSNVELNSNATGTVKINYYSKCLNAAGEEKQTNKCENIKVGDVVTFKIKIEVTSCPKDPKDWRQTIEIYPIGLNESLIVDLEMLCSCPCEHEGDEYYKENAVECSNFGTLKCDICECDSLHFGRKCECSVTELENQSIGCRPDNTSTLDCSGRGNCVCGKCECNIRNNEEERIYGNYCECDNFSCDRHEGQICSGPSHGTCECGICVCKAPWGGSACNCRMSSETCYAPDVAGGEVCSGHGECICGVCKCKNTEEGRYFGRYCEKCPTCPDRCEEFKHCVQCQMYKTGPFDEEECAKNCAKFTPRTVKKVDAVEDKNLCAFYDEDDCRFAYVYYFDEQNKIVIEAQKEKDCPQKVSILGIKNNN